MTRMDWLAAVLVVLATLTLWLFVVVVPSYAAGAVRFDVCKSTTCESVSDTSAGVQGYSGVVLLQTDEIVRIAALSKCDRCVAIINRQGKSVHVVGTLRGVACKVWGGQQCDFELEEK